MNEQVLGFANKVKVLIEGYANEVKNGWVASSTVTFIESNGKKILVDPGCNRTKLLQVLTENNLKTSDIDYVFLTHAHTDHVLLAGIFENAKILVGTEIYINDEQIERGDTIPETDISIIDTPGHTQEHCSLIVPTDEGKYVVAGDVFWWVENESQKVDINQVDDAHPDETDMIKLKSSRKQILQIADFVIPGHGKIFKVTKKLLLKTDFPK